MYDLLSIHYIYFLHKCNFHNDLPVAMTDIFWQEVQGLAWELVKLALFVAAVVTVVVIQLDFEQSGFQSFCMYLPKRTWIRSELYICLPE